MLFLLGNYVQDGFSPVSNIRRSVREVQLWKSEKPQRYLAYVSQVEHMGAHFTRGKLTTWMGDTLGVVQFRNEWTDNFGGKRVSIVVVGNNGVRYHGTYYKSSGDYCRITAYKD